MIQYGVGSKLLLKPEMHLQTRTLIEVCHCIQVCQNNTTDNQKQRRDNVNRLHAHRSAPKVLAKITAVLLMGESCLRVLLRRRIVRRLGSRVSRRLGGDWCVRGGRCERLWRRCRSRFWARAR